MAKVMTGLLSFVQMYDPDVLQTEGEWEKARDFLKLTLNHAIEQHTRSIHGGPDPKFKSFNFNIERPARIPRTYQGEIPLTAHAFITYRSWMDCIEGDFVLAEDMPHDAYRGITMTSPYLNIEAGDVVMHRVNNIGIFYHFEQVRSGPDQNFLIWKCTGVNERLTST